MSILLERRPDQVAIVTLNRPEVLNALDVPAKERLGAIWREIAADPDIRAVVLHGAGPRAFCAGSDIKAMHRTGVMVSTAGLMDAIPNVGTVLPQPVIAAIHGHCLGMGLTLALHCDLRIAAPDARLAFPEVPHGMISGVSAVRLPTMIPPGRAMEFMLLGERIPMEEALRLGLVNRLAPDPYAAALDWAHAIAPRPRHRGAGDEAPGPPRRAAGRQRSGPDRGDARLGRAAAGLPRHRRPIRAASLMHLGSVLARLARRHAGRTAIRDADGAWSFEQFADRLARLGHGLLGLGLVPGDRVALLLPDGREYLECDYGTMAASLVRVPLDPGLPQADIVALLRHAGARALVTHPDLVPDVAALRSAVPGLDHVVMLGPQYEALLAGAASAPFVAGCGTALATLNFSGGTTGRPKAIMHRHDSLAAVLQNAAAGFAIGPDDVFLNVRPLWPIAQLVMFTHLVAGCTIVLGGRFVPEGFADLVASSGATRSSLVPTQLVRLLPHLAPSDPRLASLRAIVIGGSRLPGAVFDTALARIGPRIGVLYGMTEAPISTYLPPARFDAAAQASVGSALFSSELRIVGPDARDLPPGEDGEILIRGPHVMAGYWNDPAATAAALQEGWLHTGDIGRIDAMDRLSVTGRVKEVIRSGATSIVPAEVEDTLTSHPAVAEAAVVGLPDDEWGEVVTAFVVLHDGMAVGPAALIAHCRAKARRLQEAAPHRLRPGHPAVALRQGAAAAAAGHGRERLMNGTADERMLMRKLTWRIVPLLAACWVANWIDRINIGFARLGFQDDLHVTEAQIGLIVGIYSVGYLLCEVPSNLLMERIGARRTLTRIMVLWGLITVATAFARSGNELIVARLALGAAEAGFFPGALLYLTYWFPQAYRARITSRFIIANAVAGIIGAPLSGWVMTDLAHVGGLQGWQWLFIVEGIPPLILAAIVWFGLSDRPQDARWLSPSEAQTWRGMMQRDASPIPAHGSLLRAFASVRDVRVYLLAVGFCCTIISTGVVVQIWAPSIIRDAGTSDVLRVGWLAAVPWAVGVVAMLLVAASSDRMQERRWHFLVLGVVVGVAMLSQPSLSSTTLGAVATLSLLTAAYLSAISMFWTISALYLSPGARAVGIAFINTLGQLGGLVTPNLIAWTKTHTGSVGLGLSIVGIIVLVGVVAVFAATRPVQAS